MSNFPNNNSNSYSSDMRPARILPNETLNFDERSYQQAINFKLQKIAADNFLRIPLYNPLSSNNISNDYDYHLQNHYQYQYPYRPNQLITTVPNTRWVPPDPRYIKDNRLLQSPLIGNLSMTERAKNLILSNRFAYFDQRNVQQIIATEMPERRAPPLMQPKEYTHLNIHPNPENRMEMMKTMMMRTSLQPQNQPVLTTHSMIQTELVNKNFKPQPKQAASLKQLPQVQKPERKKTPRASKKSTAKANAEQIQNPKMINLAEGKNNLPKAPQNETSLQITNQPQQFIHKPQRPTIFDLERLSLDIEFPIGSMQERASQKSDDFIYNMEMIDNYNRKERIKVSHPPSGKVPQFDSVPNPMMKEDRDRFFKELNFNAEYRSGYEPIRMQQIQEQSFNYKSHFIKKKQSCQNVNIKRCSGVSYVKKSESEQLHVSHIYQKLPNLVIQASISCEYLENKKDLLRQIYKNVFCNEANRDYSLLLAWFEVDDENIMREYLLYPEKRFEIAKGRFWLAKDLENVFYFLKDKYFLCIHLLYDESQLIKGPDISIVNERQIKKAVEESDIFFGLHFKKSTSGKKAFLKSFLSGTEFEIDSDSETEDSEKVPEKTPIQNQETKAQLSDTMKTSNPNPTLFESSLDPGIKQKKESLNSEKFREYGKMMPANSNTQLERSGLTNSYHLNPQHENSMIGEETLNPYLRTSSHEIQLNWQKQAPGYYPSPFNSEKRQFSEQNEYFNFHGDRTNGSLASNSLFEDQHSRNASYHLREFNQASNPSQEMSIQSQVENNRLNAMNFWKSPANTYQSETSSKAFSHGINEIYSTNPTAHIGTRPCEAEQSNSMAHWPEAESTRQQSEYGDSSISNMKQSEQTLNPPEKKLPQLLNYKQFANKINSENSKAVATNGVKFELYTSENAWKSSSSYTKNMLFSFVCFMKDIFEEKLRNWTVLRYNLLQQIEHTDTLNQHPELSQYLSPSKEIM